MITRRDIIVSLIISIGSLVVSLGTIGIKNLSVTALFFIIPFAITTIVFAIIKPKTPFYDRRRGHR